MVARGLTDVLARMADAAGRSGRRPEDVTLVAVSKGRTAAEVRALYDAGLRDFGENRAHELVAKAAELPRDVRWHFVGTLQRRKVREVRPLVLMLHSLDRRALITAWVAGDSAPPAALVQVNVAGEEQKHGLAPEAVAGALGVAAAAGLDPVGLMVMPPAPESPEDSRVWFRRLAALRRDLKRDYPSIEHLSMGMTDDFEVAIEEGATIIRVGRAIFDSTNESV